jgi:hypothetical protein
MGVVTPERRRVEPPPPAPPQYEPPPRRRVPWGTLAGLIVLAGVAFCVYTAVSWVTGLWPSISNPFEERTVDRSQPALLLSIQNIGEYRAATGNFQVIVDLEKDTALPSELLGARTLFVAAGTVDAGVDLRGIGAEQVEVSGDRTEAMITLPPAHLFAPQLDVGRSYTYDREEGVFNQIAGLFGDDTGDQAELYRVANAKLAAAASTSDLKQRAEANTRAMLQSLVSALGFTRVTVVFAAPS